MFIYRMKEEFLPLFFDAVGEEKQKEKIFLKLIDILKLR